MSLRLRKFRNCIREDVSDKNQENQQIKKNDANLNIPNVYIERSLEQNVSFIFRVTNPQVTKENPETVLRRNISFLKTCRLHLSKTVKNDNHRGPE